VRGGEKVEKVVDELMKVQMMKVMERGDGEVAR